MFINHQLIIGLRQGDGKEIPQKSKKGLATSLIEPIVVFFVGLINKLSFCGDATDAGASRIYSSMERLN
jgi:hypothetical protein